MHKIKTTKAWIKAHRTEVIILTSATVGFVIAKRHYQAEADLTHSIGDAVLEMTRLGGTVTAQLNDRTYYLNTSKN